MSVATMEDKQTASDRNILDMLRDDQSSGSKKNWKVFRDKLRLKRTGRAWTSSVPVPASDIPMTNNSNSKSNRMMTKRGSWRYQADDDVTDSDSDAVRLLPLETGEGDNSSHETGEGDQVISLMSLLSTDGSNYHEEDNEEVEQQHVAPVEEEHVAPVEEEEEEGGDRHVCSGCRGKLKGAALGVCGHTFCKQCTKELHVSKGNCPTCNAYILEILDIF